MKFRLIAAVAVLVSGYVHFKLWNDGVKDQHMVGPAFMINAVAAVVIAVMLVAWRSWPGSVVAPFLAAGFGAATLAAFLISVTVGLYGVHEVWTGSYVWSAFIAEVVAVLAGLAALWLALRGSADAEHHGIRRSAHV